MRNTQRSSRSECYLLGFAVWILLVICALRFEISGSVRCTKSPAIEPPITDFDVCLRCHGALDRHSPRMKLHYAASGSAASKGLTL